MSLGAILPSASLWIARAASVGLGQDLILRWFTGKAPFENTKGQLIAGVAIAARNILFENDVAAAAFLISTAVALFPTIWITNNSTGRYVESPINCFTIWSKRSGPCSCLAAISLSSLF